MEPTNGEKHVSPTARKVFVPLGKLEESPSICLYWIRSDRPLENNPAVMNSLAHHLGLSTKLSFCDVLSFDDPDLLAMIPRPVHALLFLFYITPNSQAQFAEENDATVQYAGSGPNEPVLWYASTLLQASK